MERKSAGSALTCIAMSEGRFKGAVREGCFFFYFYRLKPAIAGL
jgi:hypothetical protein